MALAATGANSTSWLMAAALGVITAVILALGLSAPAHAATETWTTPTRVATSDVWNGDVRLAVSPQGLFVAVWVEGTVSTNHVVKAATSRDGVTWTTPVSVSPSTANLEAARIAVNSSGTFSVVYIDGTMPNRRVWVTSSTNGTTWAPAAQISDTDNDARQPNITVNGSRFLVTWLGDYEGTNNYLAIYSTTSTTGASWSAQQALTPTPGVNRPNAHSISVVATSTGFALAYWIYDALHTIQVRTSTDGSTWTTAVQATPNSQSVFAPTLAVAPSGRMLISYLATPSGGSLRLYTVTSADGVSWQAPVQMSDPAVDYAAYDRLAVNKNGEFVMMWVNQPWATNLPAIMSTRTTDGSNFSTFQQLTTPPAAGGGSTFPVPFALPSGAFAATWMDTDAASNYTRVNTTSPDGLSWASPQALPPSSYDMGNAALAVNAQGLIVQVWPIAVGSSYDIYATTLGAVDPALAATGANPAPWLAAAALALIAGCALLITRRSTHETASARD